MEVPHRTSCVPVPQRMADHAGNLKAGGRYLPGNLRRCGRSKLEQTGGRSIFEANGGQGSHPLFREQAGQALPPSDREVGRRSGGNPANSDPCLWRGRDPARPVPGMSPNTQRYRNRGTDCAFTERKATNMIRQMTVQGAILIAALLAFRPLFRRHISPVILYAL